MGTSAKPFLPADLGRVLEEAASALRGRGHRAGGTREPAGDCGGPAEFHQLVELFREEVRANLPLLREAVQSADAELLAGTAHKIRGAAANFGAQRLQEQCRLSRSRRGRVPGAIRRCGCRRSSARRTK